MPNFIWMRSLRRLPVAKSPSDKCRLVRFILSPSFGEKKTIFAIFWTSAFSGVANWQQSEKVEHWRTTANHRSTNGIKIFSVLQRLHGEIVRTISDVQKRDEQTNKQTDKQKLNVLKSEPHQTWHGDRGPRACSCTSKIFEVWRTVSPLGRRWKFGDNQTTST